MRLLKWAFWLGLLVLLMPSDEAQQQRMYQNASSAIERATTFCERNARVCETAGTAWGVFVKKLEIAARMGYDLATSAGSNDGPVRFEPANLPAERPAYRPAPPAEEYVPAWRR